mgnify:CR=1 FL=1
MTLLKAQYQQRGPIPQDVISPATFDKPVLSAGQALIRVLAEYGLATGRVDGRTGVWLPAKIGRAHV